MPTTASIECDVVVAATGQKLRTLNLSVVPRAGEELDLDLGGREGAAEGLFRIVRVRYHARPRAIVRTDDLLGVTLYVEAC